MDVGGLQPSGSEIFEFMRHARRRDQDLPRITLDLLVAEREQRPTEPYNESLGIRVAVQLRPAADLVGGIEHDRNVDAMRAALEFALPEFRMVGPLIPLNHLAAHPVFLSINARS